MHLRLKNNISFLFTGISNWPNSLLTPHIASLDKEMSFFFPLTKHLAYSVYDTGTSKWMSRQRLT